MHGHVHSQVQSQVHSQMYGRVHRRVLSTWACAWRVHGVCMYKHIACGDVHAQACLAIDVMSKMSTMTVMTVVTSLPFSSHLDLNLDYTSVKLSVGDMFLLGLASLHHTY